MSVSRVVTWCLSVRRSSKELLVERGFGLTEVERLCAAGSAYRLLGLESAGLLASVLKLGVPSDVPDMPMRGRDEAEPAPAVALSAIPLLLLSAYVGGLADIVVVSVYIGYWQP